MTADAVGGVWQYCVDLVHRLTADGAEVLVAVLGPAPSDEQRNELLRLPRVRFTQKSFALEWEPNCWADVDASGQWLLELDSQFHSDVVHLNGYAHAALPWRKPVVVVAHSCVCSWWRSVHNGAPDGEWAEYRRRIGAGLLACDTVVAPSEFMAREVGREYGVAADKIRVIYNFSERQPAAPRDKEPFFFAAGRVWDPAKNFAVLERAAPQLDWPVKLAGKDNGAATASTPSLQRLGHITTAELLNFMARARVFVHPALYEPFGLAVLDAARARCCLVLADIPSLRELWAEAAIFVDPRNPKTWGDELNRLAREPEACEEMGQRAFARASRYTAESSIRAYEQLYAELVIKAGKTSEEAA